jgi:hypothetical protein
MNHLLRELAPISDSGWQLLDSWSTCTGSSRGRPCGRQG